MSSKFSPSCLIYIKRFAHLFLFEFAGSYTRHDMLPWDDDVDLRVSISDRNKLNSIIVNKLASEPYSLIITAAQGFNNFDKVFFSWCPHAGQKYWRYPFIDIFYHDRNSTHIWQTDLGYNPAGRPPVRTEEVFPLVLRPLGPLWLFAPREPLSHLDSQDMRQIETRCMAIAYDHKSESFLKDRDRSVNCSEVNSIYPYVYRHCTSHNCIEYLKLGSNTIIHKITYPFVYSACQYTSKNVSYKSC
jgi:hypothetical protein